MHGIVYRYHPYGQGQSVVRGDAVTGNPRPPQYLSRHAKVTATTLAQEAKETIIAVQKLLQADSEYLNVFPVLQCNAAWCNQLTDNTLLTE